MNRFSILLKYVPAIILLGAVAFISACTITTTEVYKTPVDYVDVNIGGVSHLLEPTYPTVHLPNAMMRMTPNRADYTSERLKGLPLVLTSHRGVSAFALSPLIALHDSTPSVTSYSYDAEKIKPYRYEVRLEEPGVLVDFVPSFQSALYKFEFEEEGERHIVVHTPRGELQATGSKLSGYEIIGDSTRVYLFMEMNVKPSGWVNLVESQRVPIAESDTVQGESLVVSFSEATSSVTLRYGISYISVAQAEKNLRSQIQAYETNVVAKMGRNEWNKHLGKIEVEGGTLEEQKVFYTALYRTYERMICLSEGGRYYSAFDGQVHEDKGIPFYTDDWVWDSYRAAHPLRVILDPEQQHAVVVSYLRMAEQSPDGWLSTFPEVTGDSHRMNGMHTVSVLADAYAKGLTNFDVNKAYTIAQKTMQEKSLIPWTRLPKGKLDAFFDEEGYFPALHPYEQETESDVTRWEMRQAVAVTLAAAYDYWCLARLAQLTGRVEDYKHYLNRSYTYRTLFNEDTDFFHPRDRKGNFIMPFDYRFAGGQGARDYYGENNAYIYRWDVPHNVADLIELMGGKEKFVQRFEETLIEPLGQPKYHFYRVLPDHTGNVGQFSMSNEPAMHIPYLYNYAGEPWRTQKLVRKLLKTWFRSDLMGVPGDEDGGGLSAFVVFSMMGFYPVTPGLPVYNIGSPVFRRVIIHLSGGRTFEIKADAANSDNKYINSAKINGKTHDQPWFTHMLFERGGKIDFKMVDRPNKKWGSKTPPPSAEPYIRGDDLPKEKRGKAGDK